MLAQNVTRIIVPNSGHFIQEEQPDVAVKLLSNFFRGHSDIRVDIVSPVV